MKKYLVLLILVVGCTTKQNRSEGVSISDIQKVDTTALTKDSTTIGEIETKLEVNDSLNAVAQLISGQYKGSFYPKVLGNKYYTEFSEKFSKRWMNFDSTRIQKLIEFRENELKKQIINESTLFYPFSGPDVLYADLFFPDVEKFILIGLEPVGSPPEFQNFKGDSLKRYYEKLNTSLNAILKFSFFRTHSMQQDLKNVEVNGTIHLLFLFLSRTGNNLVSAKPVSIDSLGNKEYISSFEELKLSKYKSKGVEIVYLTPENKVKELNYFSLNLMDASLEKDKGFTTYLENLKNFNTYLKGASYLLHKTYFSFVRNIILNGANTVVQDDSGIALRYFSKSDAGWDFKLYGEYTKPVSLFRNAYQKNLDSLYKKEGATPLGFGIGYNFKDKNSNLMIAKRK